MGVNKKKKKETIEVLYDKNGESIVDEKNTFIYARYVQKDSINKYYCLFDRNGSLYNFGYGSAISFTNMDRYVLRSVSEKCFENYLTYLITKQERYYKFSNRRLVEDG